MSAAMTIFKKEFKGFYVSSTFYLICGFVATLLSYVYPISLSRFAGLLQTYVMQPGVNKQYLNIQYGVFMQQLSYLNLVLILVVPAITMRLFSEEKKLHSFELLMTSPVTSLQIVLGKYFAALAAVFGIVFVAFSYPLATSFMAHVQWPPLVISFLGIFLVGGVYASMNLFCSSLTENSLIAFAMSILFNIAIWFIGMGVEVVDSEWARKLFEHLSIATHLGNLVEGTIRTSALIFLVSVICFFVFLAERVVESNRWR